MAQQGLACVPDSDSPAYDDQDAWISRGFVWPTVYATATQWLLDGGEYDAADCILNTKVETFRFETPDYTYGDEEPDTSVTLVCSGPRHIYSALTEYSSMIRNQVLAAFRPAMPAGFSFAGLDVRLERLAADPDWMDRMREVARGRDVSNQGLPIEAKPRYAWKNLYFRSQTERKVAEALDRVPGLMFFPNCMGRLTVDGERRNREPDFLVGYAGKWGILEVDGDRFHTNAAQDHERDRGFRQQGIRVVEHFSADQCMREPDVVVRKFLLILKNS